ncbi:hypothetical protein LINPERHAP1_LOCUS26320 [Linum perenne]
MSSGYELSATHPDLASSVGGVAELRLGHNSGFFVFRLLHKWEEIFEVGMDGQPTLCTQWLDIKLHFVIDVVGRLVSVIEGKHCSSISRKNFRLTLDDPSACQFLVKFVDFEILNYNFAEIASAERIRPVI